MSILITVSLYIFNLWKQNKHVSVFTSIIDFDTVRQHEASMKAQIPQFKCSISHNNHIETEICTFLFVGLRDRCIVGFLRAVYSNTSRNHGMIEKATLTVHIWNNWKHQNSKTDVLAVMVIVVSFNTLRSRQMVATFQTTFSNAFCWMKMC